MQLRLFPKFFIRCSSLSALFQKRPDRYVVQNISVAIRPSLIWFAIVTCFQLTGCDALQKKHDSPVMAQAPRRAERIEPDEEEANYVAQSAPVAPPKKMDPVAEKRPKEDDGSNIEQVKLSLSKNAWDDWKDDTTIFNSQVAATVNGAPILNGDILDRYAGYLISVREELQKAAKNPKPGQPIPTPEEYERFRESLIQREIAVYIQKKLLVERLKGGMKPEQLKMMNEHIDDQFQKEVDRLKKDLNVSNKTELEMALNKKGTTLQNVKDNFALDRLSNECIALKSDKADPIERADLVEYYQSHLDKFAIEAKVKWQQIQVSVTPDVNKKAARKKLEQAIAELESGVAFEKVARKYSDGPTAKDGGAWDWMEAGNLKDTALEKKLFTLPLKRLSEIHESEEAICVVRVTDRQEAGRKPFRDVQQEIHDILEAEQNKNRPKRLFREMFSKAVIETQYSLPQFIPDQ